MKRSFGWLKFPVLVLGLPVLLWGTTLSKTATLYRELRALSADDGYTLSGNELPAVSHDNLLAGDYLFQEAFSSAAEEGCVIANYSPTCERTEGGLSLWRCRLQAKGPFIPLLRLTDRLEGEAGIALSSLRFSRKNEGEAMVTLDVELIQLVRNE